MFKNNDFKNKKVLILGFSLTGIAAAKYFASVGANVYLTELSQKEGKDTKELENLGVKIEFGGHSEEFIKESAFAILSPSIPTGAPILKKLKEQNIETLSDIEFCYRMHPDKMLAITGTNGKTTTTMLTEHILSASYNTRVCGNIGISPFDYLNNNLDYFVCETSSFQLEYSSKIAPKIAVFTNFTPDHIYFHGSLDNYFAAKAKMFKNMGENDFAILNFDDLKLREFGKTLKANVIYFSTKEKADIRIKDGFVVYKDENIIKVDEIPLCGEHNIQNVMCAIAFGKLVNISTEKMVQKIKTFKAPEHRCEFVAQLGCVNFYNDSKATNPEAAIVALKAFPNKTVCLIAGGRDKNTSLDEFCLYTKKYIKNVILIGEATERFEKELLCSGFKNIIKAKTLENAIDKAQELKPDIVLLSPACASFDMFKSFEHRGEVFKEYVLSKK